MIQYYFSQSDIVSKFKAPSTKLFESQSGLISSKTYVDLAKNYTKELSQFMKDYLSVKHWFVEGTSDYISYIKAARNWIENELAFIESDAYRKLKLDDIVVDGKTVAYGKAVKQVSYTEIIDAGHFVSHDQNKVFSILFKQWLDTLTEDTHFSLIRT